MTTSPTKTPVDRGSPDALRLSRLLAALATTPDGELGAFGRRKCPKVEVEQIVRARDLCDVVAEALEAPQPATWRRLEASYFREFHDWLLQRRGGK
ncbi:MAG: hypothetical protein IT373_25840 [Polyangiaceae bacterium]|nr:hypothetical protein [Polyangiaceae bacterium]